MSVNQTAAQVKLTEMWKFMTPVYPIKVQLKSNDENGMTTRSYTSGKVIEVGSSTKTIKSFIGSASRLWNMTQDMKCTNNLEGQTRLKSRNFVYRCKIFLRSEIF